MNAERNRQIDIARRAIRGETRMDTRRETTWQYHDRLAAAVVDALVRESSAREPEAT